MTTTRRVTSTDGVCLAVHESGDANATTVVLVHGYPDNHHVWDGVADVLAERGVPFLFTTGYNVDAVDVAYRDYPRCEKPLSERALFAALQPMTG